MLSAAISSLQWGSPLSPTFASEGPHGLQLAGYLRPSEHGILAELGSFDDQIPSIDESIFDLLDAQPSLGTEVTADFSEDLGLHKWDEIPELEEVLYMSSPSSMGSSPLRRLSESYTDDEIPPLEEIEHIVPASHASSSSPTNESFPSPIQKSWGYLSADESAGNLSVIPSSVMYEEIIEDVVSVPCNTVEVIVFSPDSVASSECGSESPASSFVDEPEDFLQIPTHVSSRKRRRVSQVSVASSSGVSSGDERASPALSSSGYDDVELSSPPQKRKGGRKPKFTAADRKERKKEQNRTAAERYRLKRKMQDEVVGEEEQNLIDENVTLKTDVAKLEAEVSCLKRLMRDMLKAKGIEIPPKKKTKV